MNIFQFHVQFRDAIRLLAATRFSGSASAKVVVRLKDGSELPVTTIKVRGRETIILETFADPQ